MSRLIRSLSAVTSLLPLLLHPGRLPAQATATRAASTRKGLQYHSCDFGCSGLTRLTANDSPVTARDYGARCFASSIQAMASSSDATMPSAPSDSVALRRMDFA
jgi:hypothetical protein